jgi:hypothetical protein
MFECPAPIGEKVPKRNKSNRHKHTSVHHGTFDLNIGLKDNRMNQLGIIDIHMGMKFKPYRNKHDIQECVEEKSHDVDCQKFGILLLGGCATSFFECPQPVPNETVHNGD